MKMKRIPRYGPFILLLMIGLSVRSAFPASGVILGGEEEDSLPEPRVISLETHQGFIIIHSEHIRHIRNSYPTGFELGVSIHDNDLSTWNTCQCYPRTGIGLSYFNFDNPRILGEGYIFSLYTEPFFKLGDKTSLSVKGTSGIGYLTRPHDPEKNPRNQSYSVSMNFYLQVKTGLNFRLHPKWQLSVSANYNHISNGGIEKPNNGINYPTASIGVDHTIDPQPFPDRKEPGADTFDLKRKWEVNGFGGLKSLNRTNERFFFPGIQVFYNHALNSLHALRIGGEWIVNHAAREKIRLDGHEPSAFQHHRGNLLAGHAFLLGRFRFSEQLGLYLFRPYKDLSKVYQRFSLTYRVSDRVQAGFGLKSHLQVADFLDFRVGYRF